MMAAIVAGGAVLAFLTLAANRWLYRRAGRRDGR